MATHGHAATGHNSRRAITKTLGVVAARSNFLKIAPTIFDELLFGSSFAELCLLRPDVNLQLANA